MIERILQRFKDGEYDTPNGAKLFLIDMQEVDERIQELEKIKDEIYNPYDVEDDED